MTNFFKRGVIFIEKNPAILSSLALIIIIPLLLFFTTAYLTKNYQRTVDSVLRRKALMAESVFAPYAVEYYKQPSALENRIIWITRVNPEISDFRVYLPSSSDKFKIIASQNKKEQSKEVSLTSLLLSWHKSQAIAFLSREHGVRFWNVVSPFYNGQKQKVGLIGLAVSLQDVDSVVYNNIRDVYVFLLVSILIILALVIQHTRLFQYAALLRKTRELDKAKDSFMNMAIHELRSPVVNIRGYIDELKNELIEKLSPEEKEDLTRVSISAKRLNDLISDILDVVRIQQGQLSFAPEKILPEEVAKEVIQELKVKAENKNLKLELVTREGSNLPVYLNPNRLREVLFNLVDNAIKYTQKGAIKVTVEGNAIRKKAYISVEDTGIGISAQDRKHIFEKFFRVKSRETADISGTGLGLWIVKQIVQKMKGDILVESIKGVGTKFIVVLPLAKA